MSRLTNINSFSLDENTFIVCSTIIIHIDVLYMSKNIMKYLIKLTLSGDYQILYNCLWSIMCVKVVQTRIKQSRFDTEILTVFSQFRIEVHSCHVLSHISHKIIEFVH